MLLPLTSIDINRALATLPGWAWIDDALQATFDFTTFREAMTFVLRASYVAEAMDHYPQWTNLQSSVIIRLNTPDVGARVTARDVDLAGKLLRLRSGT